jgi:coproporphyrinogen III oxidase-like Fe-S oxidoreductase
VAFREIGVNRVSLGAQTFLPKYRSALALTADVSQIQTVLGATTKMFPYTNIDMIYGMAGQSIDDVLADAETALSLDTTTIDFYPLNNVAAQPRLHRTFSEHNMPRLTATERLEQRRAIAKYMVSLGYRRINGYGFAKKLRSSQQLIQDRPNFLYHDILYGYVDDAVIGYGAGAITLTPNFNFYNLHRRHEYVDWLKHRTIPPFSAYPTNSCLGKGVVTFPYRGNLRKARIRWPEIEAETARALSDLVGASLITETADSYEVTETGWLYYVNMMYYLMPTVEKKWLSTRITSQVLAGHECEATDLYPLGEIVQR